MAGNPFWIREIPLEAPFCNRQKEQKELLSHAKNRANVVLYSPRKFGKTSLIKRVQQALARDNALIVYVDFYGVTSVQDISSRLAKAVFRVTQPQKSLFKKAVEVIRSFQPVMVMKPDEEKGFSLNVQVIQSQLSGYDLLENVMESVDKLVKQTEMFMHIVFDEFQEINELPESIKIEGLLRSHIQTQENISYTFVGSRRRLLLDMFTSRKRPFFQSCINYKLDPLPKGEFAQFITDLFISRKKDCDRDVAEYLVESVVGFPYYVQKLAYFIFELSKKKISNELVNKGYKMLLEEEKPYFEGVLLGLAPLQIALLKELAEHPTSAIYSHDFLKSSRLSLGGIQANIKKLSTLDLVEKSNGVWGVVDPVFADWLRRN